MFKIKEIELNFANVCTGKCLVCSSAHAYCATPERKHMQAMEPETFEIVMRELKKIDFDIIQTSGNGDLWLNKYVMDYLKELRKTFPDKTIWNYSNFHQFNPERTDKVFKYRLFDKCHTRVDSLNLLVWSKLCRLDASMMLRNIEYFIFNNKTIPMSIGYINYADYWRKCRKLLNKNPYKLRETFTQEQLIALGDEFNNIRDYFRMYATDENLLEFTRIKPSFWAEREDPECPAYTHIECPKAGIWDNCLWICPDGSLNLCGYDDTQDMFNYGHISDGIMNAFNNGHRQALKRIILNNEFTEYPCNNRLCCKMWGDEI